MLRKNKSNRSHHFDKITASERQLNKNSSIFSRANHTNKKYYSTINSNSEVSTKSLRKDIKELKKKYQKNIVNKKSKVNITSSYKPERSGKKSKYLDRPAMIKAALICKLEFT